MTDKLKDLMNYAIENPDSFQISWFSYAVTCTEEEALICDAAKEQGLDHDSIDYIDTLIELMSLAMWMYQPNELQVKCILKHIATAQKEITTMMISEEGEAE